ncbi:hypothetical protein HOLleu_09929 [Holothuria leucospilota]|uniref:Uncharacterized protein n=1 Tax=Holothuria leucospilota TaxID=206669 RepID=A0A9Q1CCW1_HOLLE|nr:hypothetical protein HOLleu_09929 [Holothuria leucospilota]
MDADTIQSRIEHVDGRLKCVATGNPGRFCLIDLRCSVTRSERRFVSPTFSILQRLHTRTQHWLKYRFYVLVCKRCNILTYY